MAQDAPVSYVRFAHGDETSYGRLDGVTIHQLDGAPFVGGRETGSVLELDEVRLLAPVVPGKVIAVGLNYRSHLGERPVPEEPGLFAKYPSSVIGPGDDIVMPSDATDVHYEGELVVVIGLEAKNVSTAEARRYVFGVTGGNDVSERVWQREDLQWLRAKASDTFAPIGPAVVRGLDYNDLAIQTRVNGEVRQSERSRDLIYNVEQIVSYVSRYVTLNPGDIIFTGTPGATRALQSGDVVEIEIEGVGVLENRVRREQP